MKKHKKVDSNLTKQPWEILKNMKRKTQKILLKKHKNHKK